MSVIQSDLVLVHPRNESQEYYVHVEFNEFDKNRNTLLLLHGYLGSTNDFNKFIHELCDEFNIITFDMRGHGLSGTPTGDIDWSISCLGDDVRQVLDHFVPDDTKILIVASSLSTAIALDFANNHPQRVDGLFLISPTAELSLPAWGKLILGIERFTPNLITKSIMSLIASVVSVTHSSEEEKERVRQVIQKVQNLEMKTHQKILREAISSWTLDVSNIDQPVFILAGKEDAIVPFDGSATLNGKLPQSTLVQLENIGHNILLKKPDLVYYYLKMWYYLKIHHSTEMLLKNINLTEIEAAMA